jgi:hypothetical protein
MSPQQPSWKQEARPEPPSGPAPAENKPADQNPEKPEKQ